MQMRSTIEIERSAADVFTVVSDFSRNTEWQSGMVSVEWTTEPPIRVGSTYDQVARFMGRDVLTSFEVVALEPGRSITIESRESSFPITVTRSVEALDDDRCAVTAEISGEPGGFFGFLGPIIDRMAARSVRGDYQRLKGMLEEADG